MKHDIEFSVPFRHQVRFTRDLIGDEFPILLELFERSEATPAKVLVVVDSSMMVDSSGSWAGTLISKLSASGEINLLDCSSVGNSSTVGTAETMSASIASRAALQIVGGEDCKNDSSEVNRVLSMINHFDIDRRSYVVAIGGGAVLDAVGYAAAIAHRGVRLIRIPTTTLAQDDSGVGVKNAINYFNKKNWVGTFAVPWAVINDSGALASLSDRDFRCGFSEAVKVSLLKSKVDFDFLCDHAHDIFHREMDVSFQAIERSCLWHLRHITEGGDPFEMLEARPLDFGHWSAHKMESLTDFRIRHGEAVGIGVAIDCLYSSRVFGFPEQDARRVIQCLSDIGINLWDEVLDDPTPILIGLEEFRQHLGGRLTVTMLKEVGQPINVHEIDTTQMRHAIDDLDHVRTAIANA